MLMDQGEVCIAKKQGLVVHIRWRCVPVGMLESVLLAVSCPGESQIGAAQKLGAPYADRTHVKPHDFKTA